MKKYLYMLLLAGLVISVPAASYAIVDVAAYGGYAFPGHLEQDYSQATSPSGGEAGAIAHLSGSVIPMVLDLGIGAYYQFSFQSFSQFANHHTYNKSTVGLDAYAEFTLIPIVHPFGRASLNIWDSAKGYSSPANFFKTYSFGGGLFFTVFWKLSVFAEYMYTFGETGGNTMRGSALHAGVRIKI